MFELKKHNYRQMFTFLYVINIYLGIKILQRWPFCDILEIGSRKCIKQSISHGSLNSEYIVKNLKSI